MRCRNCKVYKPESEFYKDKNGYVRKICKECVIKKSRENQLKNAEHRKAYCHEYHQKNKDKRIEKDKEYKSKIDALKTPCVKCGDSRLYVIDFHHINPKDKSFNINRKTAKSNFSIIEEEIKKCVCLCRNCHMEFHYFYGVIPNNPEEALQEYLNQKENKP